MKRGNMAGDIKQALLSACSYEEIEEQYEEFLKKAEVDNQNFRELLLAGDDDNNYEEKLSGECEKYPWKSSFKLGWSLLPLCSRWKMVCGEAGQDKNEIRKEINDEIFWIIDENMKYFDSQTAPEDKYRVLQICVDIVCAFGELKDKVSLPAMMIAVLKRAEDSQDFYDKEAQEIVFQRTLQILKLQNCRPNELREVLNKEERDYVAQFLQELLHKWDGSKSAAISQKSKEEDTRLSNKVRKKILKTGLIIGIIIGILFGGAIGFAGGMMYEKAVMYQEVQKWMEEMNIDGGDIF